MRRRAPIVLHVQPQHLLEQHNVAVALQLRERVRPSRLVGGEVGKIKGPCPVRVVVETPAAPVRNLDAGTDEVMASRPDQRLRRLEMMLRPEIVALRAATDECTGYDKADPLARARRRLALLTAKELELVDQASAQDVLL